MNNPHISLTQACTQFPTAFKLGRHNVSAKIESDKYYSLVENKYESVAAESIAKDWSAKVYTTCESRDRIHPRVNKMLSHTGIRVYKKCNTFIVEYPRYIGEDVLSKGYITHRLSIKVFNYSGAAVRSAINLAVLRGYKLIDFKVN